MQKEYNKEIVAKLVELRVHALKKLFNGDRTELESLNAWIRTNKDLLKNSAEELKLSIDICNKALAISKQNIDKKAEELLNKTLA